MHQLVDGCSNGRSSDKNTRRLKEPAAVRVEGGDEGRANAVYIFNGVFFASDRASIPRVE